MAKVLLKPLIEQIRAANDILEVIGAYLPLKRAGSTFKALCPFHKEKTPSFNVHPQRQIFHCFGCGAGGDVFRFIMQYEGVDFLGAVRILAQRAGIRVEWGEAERREGPDKDLLLKIHEGVAALYHQALLKSPAARRYLEERELGEQIIRDFLLGYAPDAWDAVLRWGGKQGYSPAVLEAAGLLVASGGEEGRGRYYDRFRNRLMFPVRDELGRVVAFSGRVLPGADGSATGRTEAAKYVNSPETALFRKGRVLYALDRARRTIVDSRRAILCEGQIDVIRCHVAGFTNAVAVQGTALTEQHAQILKRYADSVTVVLDADAAGQEASLRSAELLLGAGLSVGVASLPPNEDPDSLICRKGAAAFQEVLDAARPLLRFQLDLLRQREDFSTEAGLLRAARAVLETISKAPTAVQRDHLLRQAAQELGLSEEALRQDLRRLERPAAVRAPAEEEPPAPRHPPEEMLLAEMVLQHAETADLVRRYLPLSELTDEACRRILQAALSGESDLVGALIPEDAESGRLAAQMLMAPSKLAGADVQPLEAARDLILVIRRKALERKRQTARRLMQTTTGKERAQLEIECKQLTYDIKALQQGWEKARPILELE